MVPTEDRNPAAAAADRTHPEMYKIENVISCPKI